MVRTGECQPYCNIALVSGVKANEPIPASKFKFDISKGADVIQE